MLQLSSSEEVDVCSVDAGVEDSPLQSPANEEHHERVCVKSRLDEHVLPARSAQPQTSVYSNTSIGVHVILFGQSVPKGAGCVHWLCIEKMCTFFGDFILASVVFHLEG